MNKRRRLRFWLKKRELRNGLRHQGISHLPDYCLQYDRANVLDNSVAGSFVE